MYKSQNRFMFSLVIAILFGLSITFFAFQNAVGVPIVLGSFFLQSIPLYLVVIVSMLAGIFMAWFISAIEGMSHFMSLRKKDSVINQDKKEIIALRQKIATLQTENSSLHTHNRDVVVEKKTEIVDVNDPEYKPSLFQRIFPSSSRRYSKEI